MKLRTAVILAAGRGKRMNPLTKVIPKPMLHIAGCPLLERVILMLREAGIRHVVLVVGYLHKQIMSYFKRGEKWGVKIQYSIQRDQLGMADALKTTRAFLKEESHFLVCAADILVTPAFVKHLIRTHELCSATITLVLQKIKLGKTIDTALVRLEKDGFVSHIVEKPPRELAPSNIACLPLYILSNEVWEQVENVKKYRAKPNKVDSLSAISSANRNFKGRMGCKEDTSIYLSSPATVAASVIEGKIVEPPKEVYS